MYGDVYSAKVAEKLGMQKVLSLRYSEIVDADGRPLLLPPGPHEEVS